MSKLRVGFIGLGSMGGDQVKCLVAAGLAPTVFDVYAPSLERFQGKTGLAASIAEVGQQSDIVGICVRDDQQVREALEGDAGLLAHVPRGAIILIHSTVRPATVKALAALAAKRGVYVLDAAVSRTVYSGEGPFVCAMVGGDASLLDKVRPVLDAYATGVIHAGELGAGMALKITNNLVSWSSIAIAAQAFRLAQAGGVDGKALQALMTQNGNLTPITKALAPFFMGEHRDTEFMASQAGIGEKDLALAIEFAESVGAQAPLLKPAQQYIRAAMTGETKK